MKNYWLRRNWIKARLPQIVADLKAAVELNGYVLACGHRITSVKPDYNGDMMIEMEAADDWEYLELEPLEELCN